MSLQISPKVESLVRERAAAEGVSVDDLLARTFDPKQNAASPSDPQAHVRALLAQWQAQDNTPSPPPLPTLPGETPTQAFFRQQNEAAAHMTEEEREAEDQLWIEIEQGLLQNDRTLRLRALS